jgi:hypothetical protein
MKRTFKLLWLAVQLICCGRQRWPITLSTVEADEILAVAAENGCRNVVVAILEAPRPIDQR